MFTDTPANESIPSATVIPVLQYPDVPAAVAWLCGAFGFTERLRIGTHRVQLNVGNAAVVVAAGSASTSPAGCSIMVRVQSADDMLRRATAFGAEVGMPESHPYGERQFTVRDPGGHLWTFSESFENVPPSAWGGELVEP